MAIKNIITKKNILVFGIVVWVIFSIGYIAYDQWQEFKTQYAKTAYQKGVSDSIRTLIIATEKCVKVPLYDSDKKVEVVSVACLRNGSKSQSNGK